MKPDVPLKDRRAGVKELNSDYQVDELQSSLEMKSGEINNLRSDKKALINKVVQLKRKSSQSFDSSEMSPVSPQPTEQEYYDLEVHMLYKSSYV